MKGIYVYFYFQGPPGPAGPPGGAQPYPAELMGKDNLLVVRRRRSVQEHPALVNLPDLEADFEEAMVAITDNQVCMSTFLLLLYYYLVYVTSTFSVYFQFRYEHELAASFIIVISFT